MGEELRKRNTDCVYFLASPLTCKKGFDCEYRHNEIARLNPRDCFYWLAGNCVNATCGFRHPPMDGPAGPAFESSQYSVPVNKTNVPCYFYFNGFCSKGDACYFLHGSNIRTTAATSTKTIFTRSSTVLSEEKTAAANKKESSSIDMLTNPYESATNATNDMALQCKEALQQSSVKDNGLQSAYVPKTSVLESVSLFSVEGSDYNRPYLVSDQSLEEPTINRTEKANQSESSSSIGVHMDYKLENFEFDDSESYPSTDSEQREPERELFVNNFEERIASETMYSDVELLDEYEMHRYSDFSCSRGIMLDSMFSHKRELKLVNLDAEEYNHFDLRNYLPSTVSGNHSIIRRLSRARNGLSSLSSRRFSKPQKHSFYRPPFERRLASQVRKLNIRSLSGNLTFSKRGSRYGSFRYLRRHKPCKHHDGYRPARRQFPLSKRPVSRDHRDNPKSVSFKGPKTLSEIKEEKRRVEESGEFVENGCSVQSSAAASADFKGPKPLSDILKDKQKMEFVKEISN